MSNKIKIEEIANEAGRSPKDIIKKAQELGIEAQKKYDTVSESEAGKIFDAITKTGVSNVETTKKDFSEVKEVDPFKKTKNENGDRPPFNRDRNSGDRPFNRDRNENGDRPPFNRDRNSGDRPFNRDRNENGDRPPFNRDRNSGDRPFNRDRNSGGYNERPNNFNRDYRDRDVLQREIPVEKPARRAEDGEKPKGITIVKKRKPAISSRAASYFSNSYTNKDGEIFDAVAYGKLSEEAKKELTLRKSTKKSSSSSSNTRRKNAGEELDIFDRNFRDEGRFNRYEEEEVEEIVLLDYRDQSLFLDDEEKEEAEKLAAAKKSAKEKKTTGRPSKKAKNRQELSKENRKKRRKIKKDDEEIVTEAEIPENIRVYEFAELIKKPLSEVIKVLFNLGMMVTKNDFLDGEVIEILAEEFNISVTTVDITDDFNYVRDYEEIVQEEEDMIERAPIITIMGHVDHGKTSLLDKIRSAKVANGEAGGITQHIGAYTIEHNDKPITFIDTPGHSAFSEMRKRGAKITDIVIIVVAADDGVKPQTREAIGHAKEAGVPIIVAVNKMDKEGANPDMVKAQVAETGLTPIEWGGNTEFIHVSAKSGEGIDNLLETIQVQSEVLELTANPNRHAKAVVVESSLEKGRGPVATVIVQNGTLRIGDSVVVGEHYGKVKLLLNDHKKNIKSIAPGQTGVVVGLSGVPASGEDLVAMDSEKEARDLANKRRLYERNLALSKTTKASFDELGSMIAEGRLKVLKIILKTDVHGTLEAIKTSLENLKNDEVKISIIAEGVGGITENDVIMAGDGDNVIIVGFNVRPTGAVKTLADKNGVKLKTYTVIYEILDDMTNILTGMMKPIEEERNTGQAEIKQLFRVKEGTVAGCMVIDGIVEKGIFARLIRNGVILGDTTVHSLKRFKDEVKEVKKGYECGILLKDLENIAEGDIIETYEKIEKQAKL
jgi:translation initiation factor IF-2